MKDSTHLAHFLSPTRVYLILFEATENVLCTQSFQTWFCSQKGMVIKMLKNIPSILTPELLKILMEMGHGDELVIGDGNFPAAANAQRLVRCDGHGVPEILDAILTLMPLDTYVKAPVTLMDNDDEENRPPVWKEYEKIIKANEGEHEMELVERYAFYTRAKRAYAIVATGETALYANIIIKKGVVSA